MVRWRAFFLLLGLAASAAAQQLTLTVLATTDLHGNLYPYDYYTGKAASRGLAKVATLVREIRRSNPNTVLIDCGDTIQGTPLESVYQYWVRMGRLPLGLKWSAAIPPRDPMMEAMNALGYAAMVVGNHEFNFGPRNFEKARSEAKFPWLAANIEVQAGAPYRPFDRYRVVEVGGARVAVVGITTPNIPSWEPPDHIKGLRFRDGVQVAREVVRQLRQKQAADVYVAAVHAGLGSDPQTRPRVGRQPAENMVLAMAYGVPELDAIIYGHSHQEEEGRIANGVLLIQPRHWGTSLARVDFELTKSEKGWKLTGRKGQLIRVRSDTPADPEIMRLGRPYHELAEAYLETPVALVYSDLDSREARFRDTALADAIHEVQLYYTKADVSLTPVFTTDLRIPKGKVTVRQLAALYPYENELYAIEGTGQMVKQALENAARYFLGCTTPSCEDGALINRRLPGYHFDTAQGVSYEVDLRKPVGQRIVNLKWRGRPLDPKQRLVIAINGHRLGGSGGYSMFSGARVLWRSHEEIRNLIVRYFMEKGHLPERADNNWRIIPESAVKRLDSGRNN